MKIAIFTDAYAPQISGVSRVYEELVNTLMSEGHEVRLFIPADNNSSFFITDNIGTGTSTLHRSPAKPFWFAKNVMWARPNKKYITGELSKFNPDVIHSATEGPLGRFGRKYAIANKVPWTCALHTDYMEYLQSYNIPRIFNKVLRKYIRWFVKPALEIWTPSDSYAQKVEYDYDIINVKKWTSGVDLDKFNKYFYDPTIRTKLGIPPNHTILLYVGRLSFEKNLGTLANKYKKITELNKNVSLILVGDGPKQEEIKDMFRTAPNVYFVGSKTGLELSQYYASADIFLFTSTTETFGTVIIEAMASGLAVVCSYEGGVTSIVNHIYSDRMDDNIQSIHSIGICSRSIPNVVSNLINSPLKLQQIRNNAIKHVEINYNWHIVNKVVIDVWKNITEFNNRERNNNQ